jgi:hypothetical protein
LQEFINNSEERRYIFFTVHGVMSQKIALIIVTLVSLISHIQYNNLNEVLGRIAVFQFLHSPQCIVWIWEVQSKPQEAVTLWGTGNGPMRAEINCESLGS